jgi:hypothetical protein
MKGRTHSHFVSDRPNNIERLIAELEPLPMLNVFQCSLCRGPVDRHAHLFQCRECKAIGDLFTGIMTPNLP